MKRALGWRSQLTIEDLRLLGVRFDDELKSLKQRLSPRDFAWYPYSSMGVFEVLKKLLGPDRRNLLRLAGDAPVLDIGCGDGDLSFYLESLGCQVFSVDCPATNHNGMRGIAALRQARGSAITVEAVDLDTQFRLPGSHFGLTLFLGLLYHLKNPYYVLETLAQKTDYCLLSTRIAAIAPGGEPLAALPVAYLLGEGEANNDWTNYWIFSEAGLRRLLHRTGWQVLDFISTGPHRDSDPVRGDRDERAWCLLRSRFVDPDASVELLDGWHELEQGTWRWTAHRFSLRYRAARALAEPAVRFEFTLPGQRPIELQATANGIELPAHSYFTPGLHLYSYPLPEEVRGAESWTIEFQLKTEPAAPGGDRRELGVVVSFEHPPVRIVENDPH